ncbi:hypothetical protein Godav_020212, partial [Gossypium davidsonii]|nr:hypothetical protein [Gossypium davidsonii]
YYGSAHGKLEPARCNGVLRDDKGLFSGPLGVMVSNEAKLYAVKNALLTLCVGLIVRVFGLHPN